MSAVTLHNFADVEAMVPKLLYKTDVHICMFVPLLDKDITKLHMIKKTKKTTSLRCSYKFLH